MPWNKRFASADELRSDDSRIPDSGTQYSFAKNAAAVLAGAFPGRDVQASVQGHANPSGTPAGQQQLESITITVSAKPSEGDAVPPLALTPAEKAVAKPSVAAGATELDVAEDDMAEVHGRGGRKTASKAPSKPATPRRH